MESAKDLSITAIFDSIPVGGGVEATVPTGYSLFEAANVGNIEEVMTQLAAGANINYRNSVSFY